MLGAAGNERPVFDVLVKGRPSIDLTFLGLPHLPRLGEEYHATGFAMNPGAGYINAAALARLGLRTGFATDLGNDFFSQYIHDRLRAAGIDEAFVRFHDLDLTELSVGLSFPHERTFITWDAVPTWQGRGVLLDDLSRYRVRCLFTHRPFSAEVAAEARRLGIPIAVDTFWDTEYLRSPAVRMAMAQADVFMPNLLEACAITGAGDAESALAALAHSAPMVAIKLGAQGTIGSCRGRVYRVPALPIEAVDTTGAGDNFDAGLIYGLVQGFPFEECLRCAVVAGSLSTRWPGGVQGSPTVEELHLALRALDPATLDPDLSARLFES